jgi:hypothetical protein
MFRIGGAVRGLLLRADEHQQTIAELITTLDAESRSLPSGLIFIPMTRSLALRIDGHVGVAGGIAITGFELLTAGVMDYAAKASRCGAVAYVERSFGMQLVDCAVAWVDQRVERGPVGSASNGDDAATATSEVLDAFDLSDDDIRAVLGALNDIRMPTDEP